jgi:hypothetical protein
MSVFLISIKKYLGIKMNNFVNNFWNKNDFKKNVKKFENIFEKMKILKFEN